MQRDMARPTFVVHEFETARNVNDPAMPEIATYRVHAKIENRGPTPASNVRVYVLLYSTDLVSGGKADPSPFAEIRYGDPPVLLTAHVQRKHGNEPHYVVMALRHSESDTPWMYLRKGHDDGGFPNHNHLLLRAAEYKSVVARVKRDIAEVDRVIADVG